MAVLIDIANLTRRFGGVIAVNALSLSVHEGELGHGRWGARAGPG